MKVWRLSKARYARAAFTGEGARIFGGRWNSVGIPMVYASASLSLAVLEVFVHLTVRAAPNDFVSVCAKLAVDETAMERVDTATLPGDWRRLNHPALQAIGDKWAREGRSLVLLVPSVVVAGEWNALINPQHADAVNIMIEEPKPFQFDERLFSART